MPLMNAAAPKFTIYKVEDRAGWKVVSDVLHGRAAKSPLPTGANNYSKTEEEAFARTQKLLADGKFEEITKYSSMVLYQGHFISLVLTKSPGELHLSITGVVFPGVSGDLVALPDGIVQTAAHAVFGECEERKEGVMPTVRHFYQRVN